MLGTVTYCVTDPDREEIFITDKYQARQIPIQVWYPAENTAQPDYAPYIRDQVGEDLTIGNEVRRRDEDPVGCALDRVNVHAADRVEQIVR